MANRRKFIAGLGALATGSAAAMGTGAFSSVEAERTLTVETAGDSSAYLRIDPSNTDYATQTGDTVEITPNELNADAVTEITDILTVENQGSRPVHFWIDAEDFIEDIGKASTRTGYDSYFDRGLTHFSAYLSDPNANAGLIGRNGDPPEERFGVVLTSGADAELALEFDMTDLPEDYSYDGTVTFWAVSDDSEKHPDAGPSAIGYSPKTSE